LLVIYAVVGAARKKASLGTPPVPMTVLAPTDAQAPPSAPAVMDEPMRKPARRRKAPGVVEITVETPLGPVTIKRPRRPAGALVVALGQSEDHLEWYYSVYRRDYLKRAVANLKTYEKGMKDRSSWSDSYFEFMQDAPNQLANLADEREQALKENRRRIERGEVTVLGVYPTMERAREAARYLPHKKEPILNAGWLRAFTLWSFRQLKLDSMIEELNGRSIRRSGSVPSGE
jgi:hypothetical protein